MESKKINQLATEMAPATSDLTIIGDPITGVSKKITLLQIADLFTTLGTVTSVAVTETGDALTITGSPITSAGTINIGFAGAASQYVRGDGALADFPTSTGGGSSVSYYLNSSVSQGTLGGVAYRELSKEPVIGAGTDITISANGYVASYITDANDPSLLEVPGGNFNCEFYFSVNSNNHNPSFYAELYKYDGSTFTLLGSSQSVPEYLSNGTTLSPYYFAIPVAVAALTITDRLAIRIYVNVDGRTVTLHTENSHLCQVVTTFSKGLTTLNNLTKQVQYFATGTSGTDFAIASSGDTHTFNLPVASATNTGKLSSTDWSTFNSKQAALNGTGFVKATGTTITYDNSTYLTTSAASSTYLPLTGGTLTSKLTINTGGDDNQFQITGTAPSMRITNVGGTINAFIGLAGTSNNYFTGSVFGDMCIGNQLGSQILFGFGSPTAAIKMSILSSGRVGIGTNTPARLLDVSAAGASYIRTSDTTNSVNVDIYSASSGGGIGTQTNHDFILQTNNTERIKITSAGNTQPGTDNAYSLGVSGTRWSAVWAANGTIQTSDEREKKDIVECDLGLDFVSKLRPVSYKWIVGKNVATSEIVKDKEGNPILDEDGKEKTESVITPIEGKRTHYGLIAQEVEALLDGKDFGGFIHDEETDIKGLRYDQFVPLLIKSIQELQAKIVTLESKIK